MFGGWFESMTESMTRRSAVFLCAALFLLAGCDLFIKHEASFYQKLSVTLDVDGRTVTGSSVIKATISLYKETMGGGGGGTSYKGEAVTIDLGKGYYLFALLKNPIGKYSSTSIARRTFEDLLPTWRDFEGEEDSDWKRRKAYADTMARIRAARAPVDLPLFVTFGDITKPETVKVVKPGNMLAAFPEGAFTSLSLQDITLELVDKQPLTEKVEKVLGWIRKKGVGPDRSEILPNKPVADWTREEIGRLRSLPIEYRLNGSQFITPINFQG